MKSYRLLSLALPAVLVAGCAATPEASHQYPPDLKSKYIHAVERKAASSFTKVYWVHAPTNEEVERKLRKD